MHSSCLNVLMGKKTPKVFFEKIFILDLSCSRKMLHIILSLESKDCKNIIPKLFETDAVITQPYKSRETEYWNVQLLGV